ncbi:MAG TPA: YidC/Oxa1 family membrane protein insertase [Gaiellaceae bacterium]|nr:YidC/Oxa1 family membrane protein insertase [Gaiellaceae bacterium]
MSLLGLVLASSNPLTPLENALRAVLEWLHGSIGLQWSWSIVALTVMVRMLLVPLTVKQIHSMQSLQRHAPEMKEIQKKYKGDKQKQNEELMKFYKENNINPAAPCLPLVVQIPIFFALYFVLKNFTKHVTAAPHELSWLIVPNITHKITSHWSGYVLLVVYVVSQVASGYFASATAQRSQRILLMVLPVFFVPVITRFPVGLLMYWMTTNLWTVGQGIVTRRMVPKPTAPPKRTSRTPPKDGGALQESVAAPSPRAGTAAAAQPSAPRRVRRKKKRTRR